MNGQFGRKSGAKDPRGMMRFGDVAAPGLVQADQAQLARSFQREASGVVMPMPEAREAADASLSSINTIRVEYTPFFIQSKFIGSRLLVPRNQSRSSLIVYNNGEDNIVLSFGLPQASNNANILTYGIVLTSGGTGNRFIENSGLVGINEIYITSGQLTNDTIVVAYEGTPALQQPGG